MNLQSKVEEFLKELKELEVKHGLKIGAESYLKKVPFGDSFLQTIEARVVVLIPAERNAARIIQGENGSERIEKSVEI